MAGAIILLWPGSAWPGSVDFSYENFYIDHDVGRARVILKITNGTPEPLASVIAECAFLNADQKAVDVATAIASNVPAYVHAYADAWSADVVGIEHADCRISNIR